MNATVSDQGYRIDQFRTRLPTPDLMGKIKQVPEDFVVTEQLGFEPEGTGEHIYFDLIKTNANTGWVAKQITDFVGVNDVDVSYAGRKDRHAITRQWFSCYSPREPQVDWQSLCIEGVEVMGMTRHRSKLRKGQLAANRFGLLVRHDELSDQALAHLDKRLEDIKANGFPNYFGPQRFGHSGNNLQAADQMLRAGKRIKGNRGIYISAARSWLFNHYLADQLDLGVTIEGNPMGPLIGKARDPQPGEDRLDEQLTAWVAGLRKLGAKVDERALFVKPAGFEWRHSPEGLQMDFELPPGAFATSLLRELFIVEDVS
jgi:tRNA pseudouridine13 synthase